MLFYKSPHPFKGSLQWRLWTFYWGISGHLKCTLRMSCKDPIILYFNLIDLKGVPRLFAVLEGG